MTDAHTTPRPNCPARPARPARSRAGFTLVELLVVIGIIALLISILLPALSRARAQANTVKCASQLREIGNALALYSNENKGAWPVVRFEVTASFPTDPAIRGMRNPRHPNIYWYMFLLKYFSKKQYVNQPGARLGDYVNTPLFGCPAVDKPDFEASNSAIDYNSGYGMAPYATYTPDRYRGVNSGPPPGSAYKGSHWAFISLASGSLNGRFYRRTQWTQPAEHGIIADSRSWFLEVRSPGIAPNTKVPPQIKPGAIGYDPNAYDQFDRYRHGKRPHRVAFNVLFCDGHVSTLTDAKQGYIAMRRKFPG